MLPIIDKLIKYNYSKRSDKIKYIVVHTTGNTKNGAGVRNHFSYFNGGNRGASADYFVDDKTIARFIQPHNYSWAVGDGKGKYGITNNNSISVEVCVNADGDYNKALENTVDLVKHLRKLHNIPLERVIKHYNASGKQCPYEIIKGKNGITWDKFMDKVKATSNINTSSPAVDPVAGTLYRVRTGVYGTQFGAFRDLNNAIKCADENKAIVYDEKMREVYPNKDNSLDLFNERVNATVNVNLDPRDVPSDVYEDLGEIYKGEGIVILAEVCDKEKFLPVAYWQHNNISNKVWVSSKKQYLTLKPNAKVVNVNTELSARYEKSKDSKTMGKMFNNEKCYLHIIDGEYALCTYGTSNGYKTAWFTAKYIQKL